MVNKYYPLLLGLLLLSVTTPAQNAGIGTNAPNASAQLDISSSSHGLLIPRMTTGGIRAIPNPAKGLLVYDSTLNLLMVNNGNAAVPNWQPTVAGSGWSLTGNTGVDPATQFIGSIDNTAINFRVGNAPVGALDNTNVYWGLSAGQSGTTGTDNVGLGHQALATNTTGSSNIGIGDRALFDNVTGRENVALGPLALYGNLMGGTNIAVGAGPLYTNGGGNYNVAIGTDALLVNQYDNNVAVGTNALGGTTFSAFNTALGFNAGWLNDLGYNNVFLGANTGANGNGFYNDIAIGQDVYCSDNSQVRIGNAATSSIGGYVGWSTFSDGRIKKDIAEGVKGLEFIGKLRPVTYRLDLAAIDRRRPSPHGAGSAALHSAAAASPHHDPNANEGRLFSGFVAQEVEKASQQSGYDFGGVDKPKNENDLYTLRYADFIAPLVKSLQELNARLDELEKENTRLKQQLKKQTL